jgi:hypothetical protein
MNNRITNRLESITSDTKATAMVWTRAGYSINTWRLVSRGRVFATFTFLNAEQTHAVLRTAAGAWEIRETFGGVAPHVGVRPLECDEEIAVFRPATTGNGTTHFASGSIFRWRRPASNMKPASIVTLKGGPIADVGKPLGAGRGPVTVFLAEDAMSVPEIAILLGLGLYTSLLQSRGTLVTEDADYLEDTVALSC